MARRTSPVLPGIAAVWWSLGLLPAFSPAQESLRNERYQLELAEREVMVRPVGAPAQRLTLEFTVLWSDTDPRCTRSASHPNYAVAPREAVRWQNPDEPLDALNAWLASPEFASATGLKGLVRDVGDKHDGLGARQRSWEFHDAKGRVALRIAGRAALDTTRPFSVGHRVVVRPSAIVAEAGRLRAEYPPQDEFALAAEISLAAGEADPQIAVALTPRRAAFFSVAFTGAPDVALRESLVVPQECAARAHRLFDFVLSEADLHLPRVQVATSAVNIALAAAPGECRFRLPTLADSRFGLMLARQDGRLKPVLLAPLLGGVESRMDAGRTWRFGFCCVIRPGDWKETYRHIACGLHRFRDQRDASGPGSLNAALERIVDFLTDRRGGNHAMWDPQQKYYDYFTDKTGVFKPFSPLYGLSVAIVTDDEALFLHRARPAVEFALSRQSNVFAPYDAADNHQANSATRRVGSPYLGYAQLASLDELFHRRTPVFRALAEAKGSKRNIADALARWRLTGDAAALAAARATAVKTRSRHAAWSEDDLFDLLELYAATGDPHDVRAAAEAAYHNAVKLNLYPAPPDGCVTVDRGGRAPVHLHSFGRHRNIWGFPEPQPLEMAEQSVPAWRIARLGLPGIAYPIEYWMNLHGALMRTAGLAQDGFLRDVARWGMVGRFGNYPGDNRSQDSLVAELPDAVERRPWQWNFATVNPGHAWDFAGAVLDFLVADAFQRSQGRIDFPASSAAGSKFRVAIYGGAAGRFYGDENVRLWLPRGLVASDNRQLDWLAGYGNGCLYLAVWNQSFREERANLALADAWVQCDAAREARAWRNNVADAPRRVVNNRVQLSVAPQGIVALAIPAAVKPRLQSRLYDAGFPPLPAASFADCQAPFGPVHAMLLRAGRGLTTALVYTEALPEDVIAARLRWRQGQGPWQSLVDDVYPYEFSPPLRDGDGDFTCVLEVEDVQQRVRRSPVIDLATGTAAEVAKPVGPPPDAGPIAAPPPALAAGDRRRPAVLTDEFLRYLQSAANGDDFGLRADGRFYPYSTPQGRRIGWRQPVWDLTLFARGCTREEAERQLLAELTRTLSELEATLAARRPPVDFARLDRRQQEILLDFAHSEGVAGLRAEFVSAVLGGDWKRLMAEHLAIRYAGHAPDHMRNKAFAGRTRLARESGSSN